MLWKQKKINVFLQDGEAHGVFQVSVCSPVNCITLHGFDKSITTVSRRGTARASVGASCFSLLRRMLQLTVTLVCPITKEPLKMPVIPKWLKKTLSVRMLTACGKVAPARLSVPMCHTSSRWSDSILPRQRETGSSSCSSCCSASTHSDNA